MWDRPELVALADGPRVWPFDAAPALSPGGSAFDFDGVAVAPLRPRRPQRAQRRRRADRHQGHRRRRGRRRRGARATSRAPGGASSASARRRRARSWSTTTPTTRPRCAATLDAARTLEPRRVIAVFQPHLFSRTKHSARAFGAALARADLPVVTEIYPARERAEDYPGVSGRLVAEAAADAGGGQARRLAAGLRLRRALPALRAARGRPAAHARGRRHRHAGQEAGRSGSNSRSVKKILAGVVVAACALTGGWFWLRDSDLVRVQDVFVTGLTSQEEPQIREALKNAALDMTTLHVREDQLRAAVAQYPSIAGLETDAKLPHKLSIVVRERAAVAAIESGGSRVAASGDGRVLRGMKSGGLPTLHVKSAPAGERVTDRRVLGALERRRRRAAAAAPPDRASLVERARADARSAQRSRPRLRLRLGRPSEVAGGGPRARRSERRGRHLSRPPGARTGRRGRARTGRAGGHAARPNLTLNLQSRVARLSTRSRDLGVLQDVLPSYACVDRNAEMTVTCENPNRGRARGTLDSY